jgi:hypoxanthine phosphoribosyltransferase
VSNTRMAASELEAHVRQVYARADRLYGEVEMTGTLDRLASEIGARLAGRNPLVLCVLTGGIVPVGHLLTRLRFPLELDYLHATRYRGETSGSALHWICRPSLSLRERTVLVVDDILDEGHTLAAILAYCRAEGARETLSAVLVEKRHGRRAAGLAADFTGVVVEDRYVFGYGMDYRGYWRNLPGIYAVSREDG